VRAALFVIVACGLVGFGCGHRAEADPFGQEAPPGGTGEGGAGGATGEDAGPPPLDGGEPCSDDAECDDGIDCTQDSCDAAAGRCVHDADDALCDDGVYCDGVETCSATLGCQSGPVITCSTDVACTIDTCVEATQSCEHVPRDADGDGDPPIQCGGTDCNDFDPLVSGNASEICGNGIDDNCNGVIDENDCVTPLYDRCSDALEIDAPGAYTVSTVGAAKDYAISCEAAATSAAMRDVVIAVTVPDAGPEDVDIVASMGKTQFPGIEGLAQTTFDSASKAHLVSLPGTINAGDLLVCLFGSEGAASVSTPDGWTALATTVDGDESARASAFYRIASGSEDGQSVNFSTDSSARGAAQVFRITDWNGTAAGITAFGGASGTSAAPTPPDGVAPWGYDHNLWLSYAAVSGSATVESYPLGFTSGTATSSGGDGAPVQIASAYLQENSGSQAGTPFGLDTEAPWAAGAIVIGPVSGNLVLAGTDDCGKASGETACTASIAVSGIGTVARLVLRDLAPGAHAVYVAADRETDIELHVDYQTPAPAPTNETCGTSDELVPGVPVDVLLAGLGTDLETACDSATGELVYHFTLTDPSDVRIDGVALDSYGAPVISLRDAACVSDASEITCRSGAPSELFARALAAGTYTVAVSGTGPAEVEVVLSVSPASMPPPTEGCSDPPALDPGVTEQVSLADATDAVQIGCLVGAPDATYALDLTESSDVLLVQTGSDGDTGGVLVADAPCSNAGDALSCQSSDQWPVRTVAHGVGPGNLRAVVETAEGNPTTLTAFTRPAVSSVFVQGADECDTAYEIPSTGGRFEGNTANEYAQYDASCDYGGQGPGGAPDQLLQITLDEQTRVVLDATGSSYQTILVLRQADGCPGDEVEGACSVSYMATGATLPTYSYIDQVLDPGTYYIQLDGYNGDSGRWTLEVFTSPVTGDQDP
jgi:Putative metal-binding motif